MSQLSSYTHTEYNMLALTYRQGYYNVVSTAGIGIFFLQ